MKDESVKPEGGNQTRGGGKRGKRGKWKAKRGKPARERFVVIGEI